VVYVVDDDPLVTESLGTALRVETDDLVHTFNSPSHALAALAQDEPDLVISDFKMPGIDGLSFLQRIREALPEAVLMLLTGYADKESAVAAINQLWIFQYLEKPWDNTDLLLKIRNAIDRRRLHDELHRANEELRRGNEELRLSLAELERTNAELTQAHARLVQSEQLAAVGRLADGIACEMSNQLALMGYADAIRCKVGHDPELVEFADQLRAAQQRLVAMLDEIKDFAHGGADTYSLQPTNVVEVADEALAMLQYDREVRRRRLTRRYAVRPLALGHRGKLAQVVLNLVRNAAQATEDGAEIEVVVDEVDGAPRLAVVDHGAGMTEDVLRRLGEPFFTTRARGTGLGLGISRRIVEEHGGRLTVESAPGSGTTVAVVLPPLGPTRSGG
jgi:signal transduction histidine kinase